MARLIDISLPLFTGMVTWPGDIGTEVTRVADMDRGDRINLSRLSLGAHAGTHLDAPLHFVAGAASVDQAPLSTLVGPARVVRVEDDLIRPEHLAGLQGVSRVLFRTRNSELWGRECKFRTDYVYLSPEAAAALVEMGVRLVGVDYLSIDGFRGGGATHRTLLGAGVFALEGLNLSAVEPGDYELICLPLLVPGAEGAPARAVLRVL